MQNDLKAVISTAVFEAKEGLIKMTDAGNMINQYVQEHYVHIDENVLDMVERLPVRYIAFAAFAFGLCFPVSGGRVQVRCDEV
ncbi:MAG: hypothetical protein ACI4LO_00245 [Anaerovoracaceae bacterium]